MGIIEGLQKTHLLCEKAIGRELTKEERKILAFGYQCGVIDMYNEDITFDIKIDKQV